MPFPINNELFEALRKHAKNQPPNPFPLPGARSNEELAEDMIEILQLIKDKEK